MAFARQEDIRVQLIEALEATAEQHGIDIVDVEVTGAEKAPVIRVRIDHASEDSDPITLDEISEHTGWINEVVDELDPIEGRFNLEVSSPGLARPLRKERDFERFAGEDVSLKLNVTEGRRKYTGRLDGMRDGMVHITTDEGPFAFELDSIRACNIKPDFGTPKKEGAKGGKRTGKR